MKNELSHKYKHSFLLLIFLVLMIFFPCESSSASGNSFYGTQNNMIFKADSSGNTIWVKDFNGRITTATTDSNIVYSPVSDGTYLYSLEIQSPAYMPTSPHTYYPGIIVLDTLGNLRGVHYKTEQPGGWIYDLIGIMPSIVSGAWIAEGLSPGHTYASALTKVNSSGATVTSLGFYYTSKTYLKCFIPLPDSNYVAGTFDYFDGCYCTHTGLTKFRENGTAIWRKEYHTLIPFDNEPEIIEIQSVTADSSGNIYMFCRYTNYTTNQFGVCGIKVDSNGIPIVSKLFPSLSNTTFNQAFFRNGEIIDNCNGLEIHFDTLLNNVCLNSTLLSVYQVPEQNYSSGFAGMYSSSFSPTNGQTFVATIYPPNILPEYCSTLSVNDENSYREVRIFPNPATDKIMIRGDLGSMHLISIYDLTGRVILEKFHFENNEIDVSFLRKGIYLMMMESDKGRVIEKLVIN